MKPIKFKSVSNFIRRKENVILDSNIINGFCSDTENNRKTAGIIAHTKDDYLYTEHVHKELIASRKKEILAYARRYYHRMIRTGEPTSQELSVMPKNLKADVLILHDAIKTDADIIVTDDRKFKSKANGYNGIVVINSEEYVRRKKR